MSAAVRPIHLPSVAAFDSLRQRAQAALDAWMQEWLSSYESNASPAATLQLRAAGGSEFVDAQEHFDAVRSETGCIWFRRSPVDRCSFGRAVVGAGLVADCVGVDDWIDEVIDRAWVARNRAVCSALLGAPTSGQLTASIDASVFAFGSGAVQLSCDLLGMHAIADSAVWPSTPPGKRPIAPGLPKLTPLDQAARHAMVRLDVMLGSVEVELPKLLELGRGDVLRLPRRLNEGIAVLCAGRPLTHAVLGETHGRKCVRVFVNDE
jgi:Type III flagellar switch regulator (C-ring) FliN C-term